MNLGTLKAQEEKAKAMYDAERAKSQNLLDVLEEARSFIARHTEPWYYSGNELLGKLDSAIAAVPQAQMDMEYVEYATKAAECGVAVYSRQEYERKVNELAERGLQAFLAGKPLKKEG